MFLLISLAIAQSGWLERLALSLSLSLSLGLARRDSERQDTFPQKPNKFPNPKQIDKYIVKHSIIAIHFGLLAFWDPENLKNQKHNAGMR